MAAPTQGILVAGTKRFGFTFPPYTGQDLPDLIDGIIGMKVSGSYYTLQTNGSAISGPQAAYLLSQGGSQITIILNATQFHREIANVERDLEEAKARLAFLSEEVAFSNDLKQQQAILNHVNNISKSLTADYAVINRYRQLFG